MPERNRLSRHRRLPAASVWLLTAAFGLAGTAAVAAPALSPEVRKLLDGANRAEKTGNIGVALIQLKNAVRLAPDNGEVLAQLGIALLKAGDSLTAERDLRQARQEKAPDELAVPPLLDAMVARDEAKLLLSEFPDPARDARSPTAPDILKARAMALEILGRQTEASAAMDRSLAMRRDGLALSARAKLAADQKDLSLAQRLIGEAITVAPENEEVLASQAAILYQSGDLNRALAAADEFIRRVPLSISARVIRIEVLLALKRDDAAKIELATLEAQSPKSSFVAYYRGLLLARAGDFKNAWYQEQTLEPEFILEQPTMAMKIAEIAIGSGNLESGSALLASLVSRRPALAEARIRLASVQLTLGTSELALKTLEPIQDMNDARVQAIRGQANFNLGKFSEAMAAFAKAIPADHVDNGDFLKQQLGQSAFDMGDSNTAVRYFKDLEARGAGNWNVAIPLIFSLTGAGRFNEALDVVTRTAKAAGRTPLSPYYRGRVLAAADDLAGASSAFSEALALDPKFLPALYFRAHVLVARGDSEAGKKDLQRLIALDPANVSAHVALAQIALHEGDVSLAKSLLNSAIRAVPKDPAPRLALAATQASLRNFKDAETTLNSVLQISPGNPQALTELGEIRLMNRETNKAVDTFLGLTAAYPNSSGAYVLLAKALHAKAAYDSDRLNAIDAAKKAVELSPLSAGVRALLVEYLIAGGSPEEGLASAKAFASAHPSPDADLLVASTLVRLKREREAYAFLESRFAASPNGPLARQLSEMAANMGDARKAVSWLEDWLKNHPGDYDIRLQYGSLLLQLGDTKKARDEFEALLKQKPDDPVVLNNLAWCLRDDDPPRAYTLVSLAARIVPNSGDVMDTLAWIRFQRRDLQTASLLLRRAHQLDPEDGEIGYHYAMVLDATGRRDEAKSLLHSVVGKSKAFADSGNAKRLLAGW